MTPRLDVAVCVAGPAPALDECLRALAVQIESPLVVLAADSAADTEAIARAAPHAKLVAEPGPGLAQARNRALAETAADVIAFVDADVVVGAGWLEALQAAWAGAGTEVACVGGPIRLSFPAGRPVWLADALLGVLGPLDHGDEPVALDPLQRTLMGGNASFRAAALRGVGGFWPARGRADARDWFSEEHHAQRELGRAGWSALYAPSVEATRLVIPAPRALELLRRRARYGARLQLVGEPRGARAALREVLRGTTGAAAAAIRGRRASATERAARAAENAGVLMAKRIAHEDFQPVAPATPFRHTVPTPQPSASQRRRREPGALVLLYHRVAALESDPLGLCVSPENFAEQLEVLRSRRVVALRELGSRPPAGAVALTFDDGYADNLTAFRALSAAGLPATLFVSTAHVEENLWFWWDELDVVLRSASPAGEGALELDAGGDARAWQGRTPEQRAAARAHLHAWLASLHPDAIGCALVALREWAGVPPGPPPEDYRPLTVAELAALAGLPGIEIGAHTRRHPSMACVGEDVAREEVAGSRDALAGWIATPRSFSYPFGVPGVDFTAATSRIVADAGFDLAVSNRPGRVTASSDRLTLPRVVAPDCDGERFARWLGKR